MTETRKPVEPAPDPGDPRLVDGTAWADLCDALARASRLVLGDGVPDAPRDRAEGFRYLTRFLAAGIAVCVEHADSDDPVFVRMIDHTMKWGLDAPDCLYLYASVRGDARSRHPGQLRALRRRRHRIVGDDLVSERTRPRDREGWVV
jgi:hypothetical protein